MARPIYWTKKRCKEEALKYNNKTDFNKHSISAYSVSCENKWLTEICYHMISTRKVKGYWTKDRCKEESLKYNTKKEFSVNCISAYISAKRNGWVNEICSHMIEKKKPNGYWTKEKCQEEALKYENKKDFSIFSPSAHGRAKKLKIMDEICSHMEISGNKVKRCIYVYEFSNNSAYIGLTYNIKNRHSRHIKKENSSPIFNNINRGFTYNLKQLTDYVNIELAQNLEDFYVKEYKKNNWTILNNRKTGGLGGNILKWTKEKCHEEALKYNTRIEFQKKCSSAYQRARKMLILNEVCSHMTKKKRFSIQ